MTILLAPLNGELLSIQQWSTGGMIAVSAQTLDEETTRLLRLTAVGDNHFRDVALKRLLEPDKYPGHITVKPGYAEQVMNRMVPGMPYRDEEVVVTAPPAEMRLVRRKGKVAAEELVPIAPVKKGHVSSVIADDVSRARALARIHFWAAGNERPDLTIVGGWADARRGEITTSSATLDLRTYIRDSVSAGAPKPPAQAEDYRFTRSGELVATPRLTRRSA